MLHGAAVTFKYSNDFSFINRIVDAKIAICKQATNPISGFFVFCIVRSLGRLLDESNRKWNDGDIQSKQEKIDENFTLVTKQIVTSY